jgi:pimeloyl-ACP methyl ester carboxylesterase
MLSHTGTPPAYTCPSRRLTPCGSNPMELDATQSAAEAATSVESHPRSKRIKFFFLCLLIFLGFGIYYFRYDLRSYSLLIHFLDPRASGPLLRWETFAVTTQDVTVATSDGPVRGRLYIPVGIMHPPGMVVVHGIHHLGIDEPRLMSFSRAAAGSGFAVLTPEVSALADYRVDAASIPTIGESAGWLQQRQGTGPVAVVGVSFAGGLALLAACDPRYAPHVRELVLMGAYDDLGRVARFLATSQAELPDGRREPYKAHDYGAAVFVYSHLEQFFQASDLPIAHEALRDWLWEQPQDAQALLAKLSPAGRTLVEELLARQIDRVRPQLLSAIQTDQAQLAAISPRGKLGNLRVPVFVLHGATDDIIPSTESLWLEREIPARYLTAVLITPAFSHVDPDKGASWRDELRLVHFLAGVFRASD